jgi:hypothetical protein
MVGEVVDMENLSEEELEKYVYFNGINGATGEYLSPRVERRSIGEKALQARIPLTKPEMDELRARQEPPQPHLGSEAENPEDLAEAGWGVIFAADDPAADEIIEALRSLLALRREEAGANYREYAGGEGYVQGEPAHRFLARHGVGPGPAVPGMVPYYLLIVGDPVRIPYEFQHGLDVQYAVGRIHFDTLDEYRSYAETVVQAEGGNITRAARAAFFGVRNPGDAATQLSAVHLADPLAKELMKRAEDQDLDWLIDPIPVGEAMKPRLLRLMGGDDTPALLFTASHGAIFPLEDIERRRAELGALVCGEWSNRPGRSTPLTPEMLVRAEDIGPNQSVKGLIAFHFACFGVGMPARDSFAHLGSPSTVSVGPDPLLAPLPQRLLGHPNGGALAVIGRGSRAAQLILLAGLRRSKRQLAFPSGALVADEGHRVGYALEHLNQRYAELTRVSDALTGGISGRRWRSTTRQQGTSPICGWPTTMLGVMRSWATLRCERSANHNGRRRGQARRRFRPKSGVARHLRSGGRDGAPRCRAASAGCRRRTGASTSHSQRRSVQWDLVRRVAAF